METAKMEVGGSLRPKRFRVLMSTNRFPIEKRRRQERELVESFISWFCGPDDSYKTNVTVGTSLVINALKRADSGYSSSTPISPFESFRTGFPRKSSWWRGKIDLLVEKEGVTWLFEAKRYSSVGEIAKALGQVNLYADLLKRDRPEAPTPRKAVVFGDIPQGLTEGEGVSHGEAILQEIGATLRAYNVTTFARDRDGAFHEYGNTRV
ncbi:MAG: hypothetical protein ABR888_00690 [Thermoplasmata archaeon]|jgi:hypothetical protein